MEGLEITKLPALLRLTKLSLEGGVLGPDTVPEEFLMEAVQHKDLCIPDSSALDVL